MKVVGKFKDECMGQLMRIVVGLHPKLYSFEYERQAFFETDGTEVEQSTATTVRRIVIVNKNTGKGVQGNVRNMLTFADNEQSIRKLESLRKEGKTIQSDHHNIYTYCRSKIVLSAFGNKRWICDDGIHTYAFGHWRTNEL